MFLCQRSQRYVWITLCDHHLTSLCVNRQANIFTPLHDIFLTLSCQELDMKYPSPCHGTHNCVHSHAAGAGDTLARLWHQENLY